MKKKLDRHTLLNISIRCLENDFYAVYFMVSDTDKHKKYHNKSKHFYDLELAIKYAKKEAPAIIEKRKAIRKAQAKKEEITRKQRYTIKPKSSLHSSLICEPQQPNL